MTQHKQILEYIAEHGSITPQEAFNFLGITKLATRVSEMRKKGIDFDITIKHGTNRNDNRMRYAEYKIK